MPAVPVLVVIVTLVSLADGVERFTSKLSASPSVALASETEIAAVSLSIMVPVPVSLLPLGRLAAIVKVSLFSSIVSSVLGTLTVVPVLPAGMVTVVLVSV
ncbi:hypothetical protein D1872_268930 [compost metagenome]